MSRGKKFLNGAEQLTLLPEDSLANLTVLPGSKKARQMTVISGRKCLALYPKSGQLGSLLKMFLESSDLRSPLYYLTWKAKVMKRSRSYFQLTLSAPRTGGIGFGLWPTLAANKMTASGDLVNADGTPWDGKSKPHSKKTGKPVTTALMDAVKARNQDAREMWPTPHRNCGTGAGKQGRKGGLKIQTAVKLLATPQARDHMPVHTPEYIAEKKAQGHGMSNLNDQIGGQLNPEWVEWLMGCPIGWTDLNCSETAKSFRLSKQLARK